ASTNRPTPTRTSTPSWPLSPTSSVPWLASCRGLSRWRRTARSRRTELRNHPRRFRCKAPGGVDKRAAHPIVVERAPRSPHDRTVPKSDVDRVEFLCDTGDTGPGTGRLLLRFHHHDLVGVQQNVDRPQGKRDVPLSKSAGGR